MANERGMMKSILFIVYMATSVCGISLIKAGEAQPLSVSFTNGSLRLSAGFVTIMGLLSYLVSFIVYTKLLTLYDLSYFVPVAMAISQVLILVIALVFFKEQITIYKTIGIALLLIGVIFLNVKK